jgi:choline kinase/mannose-6-phosphate isomerase-like protein (cupin superfamily)
MKTIIKPWGKEEWLELNDKYCYKRIYINAGYKTSYQYHNFKKETNFIISGEAEIWLENDNGVVEKKIMRAGEYFNVTPPKKHRVIALTDIILQEVSTPEVDDVIRIEDDTNRVDGKIEGEHKTPAVLILSAGLGTRLETLTKEVNKALLPINNRAIISHIIDKFPKEYEFIVATGYKGESLEEYCRLSFPEHKFKFVNIDNVDGDNSGPGYSALKCKEYLQRPFYFTTCDCLIDTKIPHLDGNWLGVYPTSYPEKYSTLKTNDKDEIIEYKNKSNNGFNLAFIGLASIWDYQVFWNELEKNILNGEIVSAFESPKNYPIFKIKKLKWLDTGNFDDLLKTREYFNDKPLSLQKDNGEITYKEGNKFIKFTPDKDVLSNRIKRGEILSSQIPSNFSHTNNFIYYNWEDGKTLYELDSLPLFKKFLFHLETNLQEKYEGSPSHIRKFYGVKTFDRMEKFIQKFGKNYLSLAHNINGKDFPAFETFLSKVEFIQFEENPFYKLFHGDLQFDNIIYNDNLNKFVYIDWRESFGGYTEAGDVYYDLAKLYGGCLIPYDKMKNEDNIKFVEGSYSVNYSYEVSESLQKFKKEFETWVNIQGYDLEKIKLITSLIFLNMSPLHEEKFGKLLWFKSIEMLYELTNK